MCLVGAELDPAFEFMLVDDDLEEAKSSGGEDGPLVKVKPTVEARTNHSEHKPFIQAPTSPKSSPLALGKGRISPELVWLVPPWLVPPRVPALRTALEPIWSAGSSWSGGARRKAIPSMSSLIPSK